MDIMGIKITSDPIQISFGLTESAANTYTQEQISLQLDVLNNEVFLVYAVDLNVSPPNALAQTDTEAKAAISSTSRTTMGTLSSPNVLATSRLSIQAGGFTDGGVAFDQQAGETYPAAMDYVGIISTNNFFVSIEGRGNLDTRSLVGRVYGARARVDAATYAALVQSEALSS